MGTNLRIAQFLSEGIYDEALPPTSYQIGLNTDEITALVNSLIGKVSLSPTGAVLFTGDSAGITLANDAATSVSFGDIAAVGVSTMAAREDHRHGVPGFGPVIAGTVFGRGSSNGIAGTVARSDHDHGTVSEADLVHKTMAETITGLKTFQAVTNFDNITLHRRLGATVFTMDPTVLNEAGLYGQVTFPTRSLAGDALTNASVTGAKLTDAAVATRNVATGTLRDTNSTMFRTATAATADTQGQPVGGLSGQTTTWTRQTDAAAFDGIAFSSLGNTKVVNQLVFGPYYKGLKPGMYRQTVYVKSSDVATTSNVVSVQATCGTAGVVTNNTRVYFRGVDLASGYVGISCTFVVTSDMAPSAGLETYVFQETTTVSLSVSHVTVEPFDPLTPGAVQTQFIRDLAITDAKITNLTATKLTAGDITTDDIYMGAVGRIWFGAPVAQPHASPFTPPATRMVLQGGGTDASRGLFSYINGVETVRLSADGTFQLRGTTTNYLEITPSSLSFWKGAVRNVYLNGTTGDAEFTGTITGSVFRTSTTTGNGGAASQGILIDATGVRGFAANSSVPNTHLNAANGVLTASGALITGTITGSMIYGGTIATSDPVGGGRRVQLSSADNALLIYHGTSPAGFVPGRLTAVQFSGDGSDIDVRLRSGHVSNPTGQSTLRINASKTGTTSGGWGLNSALAEFRCDDGKMWFEGPFDLDAGGIQQREQPTNRAVAARFRTTSDILMSSLTKVQLDGPLTQVTGGNLEISTGNFKSPYVPIDSWFNGNALCKIIADDVYLSAVNVSGFYNAPPTNNRTPVASNWHHFFQVRHPNTSSFWAMAIASTFSNGDARVYMQKTEANAVGGWHEFAMMNNTISAPRYNVGDDLYFLDINEANTVRFQGNQDQSMARIRLGTGNANVAGFFDDALQLNATNVYVNGNFINNSSARNKSKINNITKALDTVLALRPVTFDSSIVEGRQSGLLAEEVNDVLPDVVAWRDGKIEGLNYINIIAYALKAIQELADEVQKLKIPKIPPVVPSPNN